MHITEIEQKINKIEDLRDLNLIQAWIKDRKEFLGNRLKYSLQIGDKVTVRSGRKMDEGTITKINRTRAVIDMRGGSWTVPFSMITKEQTDE